MNIHPRLDTILQGALDGTAPSRDDCVFLLEFADTSLEASLIRSVGDAVSRKRFRNEAIILGQIGIEIDACPGACLFCSFGEGHTDFEPTMMTEDEILSVSHGLTGSGDLYALFLMTMHEFGFERLLNVVERVRGELAHVPQIVVNIGDFDRVQADELRAAGVNGAYHVLRLREGTDTALDPEARLRTILTLREAGLDWYYCCEPIGPEHTAEELVEQIFIGVDRGCFQHAAMRRVYLPGSPLAAHGQISELRLGQIVGVISLASLGCAETSNIAVHEPNLLGLCAGANVVYAETGANPRDTEADTSQHRGRDVEACKVMLYEAGFGDIIASDGSLRAIANAYREAGADETAPA